MYLLWQAQSMKFSEIKTCPRCTRPLFPPNTLAMEGFLAPFILKKYFIDQKDCLCGWKKEFIVKYNGLNSAYSAI